MVSYYYHKWIDNNTWVKINTALHRKLQKSSAALKRQAPGLSIAKRLKNPRVGQNRGSMGETHQGSKATYCSRYNSYPLVAIAHAANIYDGHAAERVLKVLFPS